MTATFIQTEWMKWETTQRKCNAYNTAERPQSNTACFTCTLFLAECFGQARCFGWELGESLPEQQQKSPCAGILRTLEELHKISKSKYSTILHQCMKIVINKGSAYDYLAPMHRDRMGRFLQLQLERAQGWSLPGHVRMRCYILSSHILRYRFVGIPGLGRKGSTGMDVVLWEVTAKGHPHIQLLCMRIYDSSRARKYKWPIEG